jgi:hypothetical protein
MGSRLAFRLKMACWCAGCCKGVEFGPDIGALFDRSTVNHL